MKVPKQEKNWSPAFGWGPGSEKITAGQEASESVTRLPDRADIMRAVAMILPPSGRRRYPAIIVPACPRCGGPHQGREKDPVKLLDGTLTRICPETGKRYRIAPHLHLEAA